MIKVIHVIDGIGWAGMEQMVNCLVSNLDKTIFDVTLLSEIPVKESVKKEVERLQESGVKVMFLQHGRRKKFLAFDYAKIFRRLRPHIVHSHSGVWRDSCLGAVLSRVPYTFHTEHGRVFLDDNMRARLTHRLLSFFRNKIISVSDDLRSFLRNEVRIPAYKLMTIHNGIDISTFVPKEQIPEINGVLHQKGTDISIIAVGRINPVKDYDTLIKSLPVLKKKLEGRFSFKVFIVGSETIDHLSDGGILCKLRSLCDELNIVNEVDFLGKRNDIPDLLARADIFVQTSLTEGLSMSIMEAMSCQLPVVATDVGGNAELIVHDETGFLIKPRDFAALAEALQKLIVNKDLRLNMGLKGRKRIVEHFSLDHMVKNYETLYLSLRL